MDFLNLKYIVNYLRRTKYLRTSKISLIYRFLDKVKLDSFVSMKATNINIRLNFHIWWSNLFICLCIGWFVVFSFYLWLDHMYTFEVIINTLCY